MGSQDSRKDGFIELEEQEVRDGSRSTERSLEEGQLQLPTVVGSSDETVAASRNEHATVWHGAWWSYDESDVSILLAEYEAQDVHTDGCSINIWNREQDHEITSITTLSNASISSRTK